MINWLEWLGYLSSVLVAVSLLMSSIIKLRWYNLVGSILFAIYGFMIHAIPVALINTIIVFINIYYLYKIYTEKEYFKLIEIHQDNTYIKSYFDYYSNDIKKYFPNFQFTVEGAAASFYILRNMVPAGLFVASKYDEQTLEIKLDFVMPEYRDFKIGKFIFENNVKYFKDKGCTKLISHISNKEHTDYLKKMGFQVANEGRQSILVRNL